MSIDKTDKPVRAIAHIICGGVVVLILTAVFIYTVEIRSPYFGKLSDKGNQGLTASTLTFATYWYEEEPWNLRFLMVTSPNSIESPTIHSRETYLSYPSGAIVPIYALSKVAGQVPSRSLIMTFNLANHLLISGVLCLIAYLSLSQYDLSLRLVCASFPGLYYLLSAQPLYWHQNVFFSDQAIIIYFVLAILLELLRDLFEGRRTTIACVQWAVFLTGFSTDHLMFFVALSIVSKRYLITWVQRGRPVGGLVSDILWLGSAGFFPALLWGLQLYSSSAFDTLARKGLLRSALGEGGADYLHSMWQQFWIKHLGNYDTALVMVSLVALFVVAILLVTKRRSGQFDKRMAVRFSVLFLLLIPCVLQIYAFRNHSVVHMFSALKFSPSIALIPFVLIPSLLTLAVTNYEQRYSAAGQTSVRGLNGLSAKSRWTRLNMPVIPLLGLFVGLGYLYFSHDDWQKLFPPEIVSNEETAQAVRIYAQHSDIFVSPTLEIRTGPPHLLSVSKKRVYKARSLKDAYDQAALMTDGKSHRLIMVLSERFDGCAGWTGESDALARFPRCSGMKFECDFRNNVALHLLTDRILMESETFEIRAMKPLASLQQNRPLQDFDTTLCKVLPD